MAKNHAELKVKISIIFLGGRYIPLWKRSHEAEDSLRGNRAPWDIPRVVLIRSHLRCQSSSICHFFQFPHTLILVTHQSVLQFHLLLRQLVLRRRQIENGSWFELVNWLRSELSLRAWASQTSQWWHISDSSTYLSLDVPPSRQICIEKPRCSTKSQRLERICISLRRNLVSFRELGLTEDSAMKHKKPK